MDILSLNNCTQHRFFNVRQHHRGFTLIEVLVAMSILAVVMVAVFRLQSQTIAMTGAARFYSLAPLLAQTRISELEMKTVEELVSDSGDFGDAFPGWTWQVVVEDVESEYLGTYADTLKRIDVEVALEETPFVYKVRTYRMGNEDES